MRHFVVQVLDPEDDETVCLLAERVALAVTPRGSGPAASLTSPYPSLSQGAYGELPKSHKQPSLLKKGHSYRGVAPGQP